MTNIENYKRLRDAAIKCRKIVEDSRGSGNNNIVHWAELKDQIYHTVAFSFNSKHGTSHQYDYSGDLAKYIGEACKEMKGKIFDRALEIADERAEQARKEAKSEAEEILQETV